MTGSPNVTVTESCLELLDFFTTFLGAFVLDFFVGTPFVDVTTGSPNVTVGSGFRDFDKFFLAFLRVLPAFLIALPA